MTEILLARPSVDYKASYIEAIREFEKEGTRPAWNYSNLEKQFDEYVGLLLARETDPFPGFVPQTDFWLIVDGCYVGRTGLRHHLNASLERFGGHIGYEIRPSMRRKGYGTLQLKLVLPRAWELGLKRVLITCDDDNIGSAKIIEHNGGVLQDKVDNARSTLTRRYWIQRPSIVMDGG